MIVSMAWHADATPVTGIAPGEQVGGHLVVPLAGERSLAERDEGRADPPVELADRQRLVRRPWPVPAAEVQRPLRLLDAP